MVPVGARVQREDAKIRLDMAKKRGAETAGMRAGVARMPPNTVQKGVQPKPVAWQGNPRTGAYNPGGPGPYLQPQPQQQQQQQQQRVVQGSGMPGGQQGQLVGAIGNQQAPGVMQAGIQGVQGMVVGGMQVQVPMQYTTQGAVGGFGGSQPSMAGYPTLIPQPMQQQPSGNVGVGGFMGGHSEGLMHGNPQQSLDGMGMAVGMQGMQGGIPPGYVQQQQQQQQHPQQQQVTQDSMGDRFAMQQRMMQGSFNDGRSGMPGSQQAQLVGALHNQQGVVGMNLTAGMTTAGSLQPLDTGLQAVITSSGLASGFHGHQDGEIHIGEFSPHGTPHSTPQHASLPRDAASQQGAVGMNMTAEMATGGNLQPLDHIQGNMPSQYSGQLVDVSGEGMMQPQDGGNSYGQPSAMVGQQGASEQAEMQQEGSKGRGGGPVGEEQKGRETSGGEPAAGREPAGEGQGALPSGNTH